MSLAPDPIGAIRKAYGDGLSMSDWFTVNQEDMNQFAQCTHDPDWMHTDPDRARREGPFGGTIAFGFWTLSMLSYFNRTTFNAEYPEGALFGFNYGIDRMRLMAPVRVGSRIRAQIRLIDAAEKRPGHFLVKTEITVEIEHEEKPAMIAEWLYMIVFPESVEE